MTLRELLDAAASDVPGVDASSGPDHEVTWARGGRPFAALSSDGAAAEFALDRTVAAAAVRTPDVTASRRGAGWVRFSPGVVDGHAADRALAWFASAYRRQDQA